MLIEKCFSNDAMLPSESIQEAIEPGPITTSEALNKTITFMLFTGDTSSTTCDTADETSGE